MIGQVPLHLIDPNPFRDFDLHPIDDLQVARLRSSMGTDGFWASVVARQIGKRFQLAFGHHRIEAARGVRGIVDVPIDVLPLNDWQMARMLASENATQRGTTAAASLDAIAAMSKVVVAACWQGDAATVSKIFETSLTAAESIWGKVRNGTGPGEDCILELTPDGAFTRNQVRLALGVLKDSRRMAQIIADARGDNEPVDVAKTFDANCARLFKLDYHLQEFRRIVTDETVQSYLPVDRQIEFAQRIITELGAKEVTGVNLRERANVLFYEELGIPRSAMRNSRMRHNNDRVRDALNLMRRGTYDIKQCCRMLTALIEEGTDVPPEVIVSFKRHIGEIDVALRSLMPDGTPKRRSSNLRLIVDNRENVA